MSSPKLINKFPESIMKKSRSNIDNQSIQGGSSNIKLNSAATPTEEYINPNESYRKDKFGTPIYKNKKIHKISFSDQFKNERNFVQISKIESHRNENLVEEKKCLNCVLF